MTGVLNRIPTIWKAVTALMAAVVFGVTVGASAIAFPSQIEENSNSIGSLSERLTNVENTQRSILQAQKEMLTLTRINNCLAQAAAKKEPYQQCTSPTQK